MLLHVTVIAVSLYSNILLCLGAFAKLRKTSISFVMSVWSHGTPRGAPLDGFSINLIFHKFSKICQKIQLALNLNLSRITRNSHYVYDNSLNSAQSEKCFKKTFRENHFKFNNFPRSSCRL
jgi:hypothetical protein